MTKTNWNATGPDAKGEDEHVVPVQWSDETAHAIEPTCWCQPVKNYEDPAGGGTVWVHRRTLDGPVYEPPPPDAALFDTGGGRA